MSPATLRAGRIRGLAQRGLYRAHLLARQGRTVWALLARDRARRLMAGLG